MKEEKNVICQADDPFQVKQSVSRLHSYIHTTLHTPIKSIHMISRSFYFGQLKKERGIASLRRTTYAVQCGLSYLNSKFWHTQILSKVRNHQVGKNHWRAPDKEAMLIYDCS